MPLTVRPGLEGMAICLKYAMPDSLSPSSLAERERGAVPLREDHVSRNPASPNPGLPQNCQSLSGIEPAYRAFQSARQIFQLLRFSGNFIRRRTVFLGHARNFFDILRHLVAGGALLA